MKIALVLLSLSFLSACQQPEHDSCTLSREFSRQLWLVRETVEELRQARSADPREDVESLLDVARGKAIAMAQEDSPGVSQKFRAAVDEFVSARSDADPERNFQYWVFAFAAADIREFARTSPFSYVQIETCLDPVEPKLGQTEAPTSSARSRCRNPGMILGPEPMGLTMDGGKYAKNMERIAQLVSNDTGSGTEAITPLIAAQDPAEMIALIDETAKLGHDEHVRLGCSPSDAFQRH